MCILALCWECAQCELVQYLLYLLGENPVLAPLQGSPRSTIEAPHAFVLRPKNVPRVFFDGSK